MTNKLYYGDNLQVLRESIPDASVDLVYLDPPFNSAANYNVLFKAPTGEQSQAQIEAFEDTWHWNDTAALAFEEVITGHNTDTAHMLRAIGAVPAGGKKKGMDRGIDGYLNFRDADGEPQHAIVSVKGGEHVTAPMIRDLKGTIDREGAAMGIFLCLSEPTREMVREAAASGFYETGGKKFPKVQMLTAEELFAEKRPQVPFGFTEGFKVAKKEKQTKQGSLF